MKVYIYFLVFLTALQLNTFNSIGQDVFFKTGLNSTTYRFLDNKGNPITNFLPGIGPSFEVGYSHPISYFLVNEFAVAVDGYNSKGDNSSRNYSWSTLYGGVKNTTSASTSIGNLEIGLLGLIGLSKILIGDQQINNARFDLKDQEDFNGIFLQRGAGVKLNYFMEGRAIISAGFDYSVNAKLKPATSERLTFSSKRVLFGIHFLLN